MSTTIEIAGNFDSEVLQSDVPVLVDFSATWCVPCQKLAPIIDELADEYQGKAKVVKVDVDNNQDLAIKYQVMSVPTVMVVNNGEVANKWIGFTSKQELSKALDELIS